MRSSLPSPALVKHDAYGPDCPTRPSDDVLVSNLGAEGPGGLLLDDVLTAPTTAVPSGATAVPRNSSNAGVFNGYPPSRRRTHTRRAGTYNINARLLQVFQEPATRLVPRLKEVAARLALRRAGAHMAQRLLGATGLPFLEPLDTTHLGSTGVCADQPAHVDSSEPCLLHEHVPGVSVVNALRDDSPMTVYSGTLRLSRRLRSLRVPQSEAGDPAHVLLKAGQAISFRQDLFHFGGAKGAGMDNNRFFLTFRRARRRPTTRKALSCGCKCGNSARRGRAWSGRAWHCTDRLMHGRIK